ncbi:MAG: hypothetical protein Q9169_007549, partial [Polycauliona sp. 2 TL-2023]
YTEGLDLVLRDQNQIAKAASERRLKARARITQQIHLSDSSGDSSSTSSSSRSVSPISSSSSSSSSDDDLVVYSSIAESRDSYAHAFFVTAYVLGPRDTRTDHGFLELMPYLFDKLPYDPILSSSLAVLCHCYFGAWNRHIRNVENVEVQKTYSKALSGLRHALKDPRYCSTDELLMAVCLLNFFEFTTAAMTGRSRKDQHVDGATALVKQRGSKNMTSDLSKRLLIAVSKALSHSTPVDDTPSIWDDPPVSMPYNPATSLDFISKDAANLLARAASTTTTTPSDPETQTDIFLEAKALDARYAQWAAEVPTEWLPFSLPRSSIPPEIISAGLNGEYCHIYTHTSVCSTWNSWRVTRMRILALIADYYSSPSSSAPSSIYSPPTLSPNAETETKAETEEETTINQIRHLADDIHASIPYMLGNKLKPSDMHDTNFIYPSLPNLPVPASHYQSAAANAGLNLWVPMRAILDLRGYMRGDQISFTGEQFRRIARLYDVRTG